LLIMKCVALALALLASASAFVPSAPLASSSRTAPSSLKMGVQDMEGILPPVGFFDPLGLAKIGGDESLAWFREAEIKHGRVCMAAFTGLVVTQGIGLTFPLPLNMAGDKFASLGKEPFAAWDNLSLEGKESIIGFIGILEVLGEAEKPHYMMGGKAGSAKLQWAFGKQILGDMPEEKKRTKRISEIQNGRLAMIGTMGYVSAACIEGSVPPFTKIVSHYAGNPFVPF